MNNAKENDKESIKETVRENSSSSSAKAKLMRPIALKWAQRFGKPLEAVDRWIKYQEETGWKFKDGTVITPLNFRRSLRMWYKLDMRFTALAISRLHKTQRLAQMGCDFEEMERIKKSIAEKKLKAALSEPNAWELCDERCANFCADGCPKCKHWSIPPQLRERPIPPEQCPHFKAKGE